MNRRDFGGARHRTRQAEESNSTATLVAEYAEVCAVLVQDLMEAAKWGQERFNVLEPNFALGAVCNN